MARMLEQDIAGWSDRFANQSHLRALLDAAEADRGLILLARGDSRLPVLRRLLPDWVYEPRDHEPTRQEVELLPAFVLGEKSSSAFRNGESLIRMPGRFLAARLPELSRDREFLSDLISAAVDEGRITEAQCNGRDLLGSLSADELDRWPERVRRLFIERLLMVVHFDQSCTCKMDREIRNHSCTVSLAKGTGRYDRALTFATSDPGVHRAIVIDSFVRRSEPETFVQAGQLDVLDCRVDGMRWVFRFNSGGHPRTEILVRRAIFPHRLLGIAVLVRKRNDAWRCLRYVANPYFDAIDSLHKDVDIPQDARIPEMLRSYDEYREQLRMIFTYTPGSRTEPAYDQKWTEKYGL